MITRKYRCIAGVLLLGLASVPWPVAGQTVGPRTTEPTPGPTSEPTTQPRRAEPVGRNDGRNDGRNEVRGESRDAVGDGARNDVREDVREESRRDAGDRDDPARDERILDERARRRDVVRVGSDYTLSAADAVRGVTVIAAGASIDGHVRGDAVIVLGQVRLASTAVVDGSLVVVGGTVTVAEGATVRRDFVVVGGGVEAPPTFAPGGDHVVIGPQGLSGRFESVLTWLSRGLLLGRPIVPSLPWVWAIVAVFFFVYLVLNLLFEAPVRTAAATLGTRPVSALVVGFLVVLLAGPVCVLLAVSVVGIAVVPLVLVALIAAGTLGKIAAARWIGGSIVGPTDGSTDRPGRMEGIRSFVLGFGVLCLAYMVPLLGMVTWALLSVFGLGACTMVFLAAYRRENPAPERPVRAVAIPVASFSSSGVSPMPMSENPAVPFAAPDATAAAPVTTADLVYFPKAWFRDRLAAGVLDLILVLVAAQFLDPIIRDSGVFLLMLVYFIGFWTWKGTTVGGIICQLRVVRIDSEPLRFVDALVRGLSSIFSLMVAGLGFLWILKDADRQAWHDRIAGTYVVKVPRNWPI